MLAGVEFGLDAPRLALETRVFSDIFLRLIKVIVAPLILGSLITGIAGHGELRSVGRLGLKSLIYFEVLTTAALIIGLVAINASRAGEGLETTSQHTVVGVAHDHSDIGSSQETALSWQQFLLHVFPEKDGKWSVQKMGKRSSLFSTQREARIRRTAFIARPPGG